MKINYTPRLVEFPKGSGKFMEIGALKHMNGKFWLKAGDFETKEEAQSHANYQAKHFYKNAVIFRVRYESKSRRWYVWYTPRKLR